MKFLVGKKRGMTTIYDDAGAHNVTLIEVVPNTVDLLRTEERDGYSAVRVSVPQGKKVHTREFRVDSLEGFEEKQKLTAEVFAPGDVVSVCGTSKAKGFQGVVKRHGFAGGPASHGHRHVLRTPGSIGSAFPEHVLKGRKMAGRTGGERVTTEGLKVVHVDTEQGMIAIKGAVPGVNGRLVTVVGK